MPPMPTPPDATRGLEDFLNSVFGELDDKHRAAMGKYVELEKELLGQYRAYLEKERSNEHDAFQNFTKMMMASWMQAVALQRETRTRLLELHASLAEAHLKFLDQVSQSLSGTPPTKDRRTSGPRARTRR
jgi:hypothetical protein